MMDDEIKAIEHLSESVQDALRIAWDTAQVDGGHHKMWTIDQMIRKLLGDKYAMFVAEYEESGEYQWHGGMAP